MSNINFFRIMRKCNIPKTWIFIDAAYFSPIDSCNFGGVFNVILYSREGGLSLGVTLYSDKACITPFNGENKFRQELSDNFLRFRITPSGVIDYIHTCTY